MPYKVCSTEKLRKSGSDAETKAMLYLMNFHNDSHEMNYFVVDFFNDVTGMDRMARKLWDVQSKASKTGGAKTIGRELVTLYKNYVSDLHFAEYIIFLGGVPVTFRKDNALTVFNIENINKNSLNSVKDGLIEECNKKSYINLSDVTDENINGFLKLVWFVIDDKEPQEYIRGIVRNHPSIIPEDSKLVAIFNEIRNKQAEKKNSNVEGVVIGEIDEVLSYGRYLTTNEIRLLVLQRIINSDPLAKGVPMPFWEIYAKYAPENRQTMLEDCQRSLCRALFNKSAAQGFWKLFNEIYDLIMEYPDRAVDYLFTEISDDAKEACPDFDVLSLKYFIAKVKEGILQ